MERRELAEPAVAGRQDPRSDLCLGIAVRYRLFRAFGFGSGLSVRMSSGAVTLSGKVSSSRQRREAEAAVRVVRGMRELAAGAGEPGSAAVLADADTAFCAAKAGGRGWAVVFAAAGKQSGEISHDAGARRLPVP